MDWKTLLAYITGTVDQELLLRNEYLVTETRILRHQLKGRLRLRDGERKALLVMATIAVVALSIFLAYIVLKPAADLVAPVTAVGQGQWDVQLPKADDSELGAEFVARHRAGWLNAGTGGHGIESRHAHAAALPLQLASALPMQSRARSR